MKRLSFFLMAALLWGGLMAPSRANAQTLKSPAVTAAPATPRGGIIRVATKPVEPFVMKSNGKRTGFSVDLWNAIAQQAGLKTQWVDTPKVSDLLNAVSTGKADCGIAAISITAKRDQDFDFSQPIYDAGLQILVRSDQQQSGGSSLFGVWSQISQPPLRNLIILMLISTLIMANLMWLVERKQQESFVEHPSYAQGMRKALWWSAGTLGAQADEMPRSPWGRLLAVMWMFLSIVFIAFFTATITTSLTVQQLKGDINGPGDLPGKRVATITGSTSESYLQEKHLNSSGYANLDAATQALLNHKVEAVVYDAPVLQYFANDAGKDKAMVVGAVFRKEDYGIAFPPSSAQRKTINTALLTLKENGTYDELVHKYFGSTDETADSS